MSHSTVRLLCHPHHQRVGDNRATSDPVLWAEHIDPALGYRRAGS